MKKIFLSILLLISFFLVKGQHVVTDPTTHAKMADAIVKAKESIEQMKQIKSQLEETKEYLNKVNSALKKAKAVESYIDKIGLIYKQGEQVLKTMQKAEVFTSEDFNKMGNVLNSNYEMANSILSFVNEIFLDNNLKMNDYERLNLLEKEDQKLNKIYYKLKYQERKVKKKASHIRFKKGLI